MCGATLGAQNTQKKEDAPERETRARQGTVGDGGSLTHTAQQIRQETKSKDPIINPDISPDDPLSAFVTEVEEPQAEHEKEEHIVHVEESNEYFPEPEAPRDTDDEEDDFEIDEDGMVILKEKDDHNAAKGIDTKQKEEKVSFSTKSPMLSPWPAEGMKAAVQTRPPAPKVQAAPPPPPPVKKEEPKYVAPPEEEYTPEEAPPPKPKPVTPKVVASTPKPPPVTEKPKVVPTKTPIQPSVDTSGRALCGWFVDLTKNNGTGIELREGRFFISQQKLKDLDLVIDEEGISSPHALLSVTKTRGIKIQDLMSEEGVYLCRHGDEEFEPVFEAVELSHGDRLKLGSVEFVLCIIARP